MQHSGGGRKIETRVWRLILGAQASLNRKNSSINLLYFRS